MHDAKFTGVFMISRNNRIINRLTKETMRLIDSETSECEHTKKKFSYKIDFADVNAREAFKTKSASVSVLKCASGHNHYRVR